MPITAEFCLPTRDPLPPDSPAQQKALDARSKVDQLVREIAGLELVAKRWGLARKHAEDVLHECGRRLSEKRLQWAELIGGEL